MLIFFLLEIISWKERNSHPHTHYRAIRELEFEGGGQNPFFILLFPLMNWQFVPFQLTFSRLWYRKSYFEVLHCCLSSLQTVSGNIYLDNTYWHCVRDCGNDLENRWKIRLANHLILKGISVTTRRLGVHLLHKTIPIFIPSSFLSYQIGGLPTARDIGKAKEKEEKIHSIHSIGKGL